MTQVGTAAALLLVVGAAAWLLVRLVRARRDFGSPADEATFRTLHTASQAAPALRAGLDQASAERAVRHLRALLGTPAVALTDGSATLAWDGIGADPHAVDVPLHATEAVLRGRTVVHEERLVRCAVPDCPVRHAVVAPLTTEETVVGALAAYTVQRPSAGLVRAVEEVARFVSGQLELAELDRSRTRAAEAEVRALRAQISPHFVYNSLAAIASFVRTDPERARELLLEFAEFTRYSFRRHGDFTTLAEELGSIDRYLLLEKARFGDRLEVTLRVAPEVLPVAIPFLCVQPLVENAVHHGLGSKAGRGHVTITADDQAGECVIAVEDDGVGMDPEHVRAMLNGDPGGDHVGLGNVDERLRAVFGDEYGLVVETGPGAGTKVSLRVPKYRAGVRAS